MVPVNAVRHGAKGDFVWVLKEDKTVTMRSITRGEATVDKVQIASGLQAGEKVITEGADRLKEGAKVTLPGTGPGAGTGHRQGANAADGTAPAGEHRRRKEQAAAQ